MTNDSSQKEECQYEQSHVHDIYNRIAHHFSSTRYKPWPVVDDFLKNLDPGCIGLDIGCGNGKYLVVNREVFILASDRSNELIRFASQHQPHSTVIADTLNLPHPPSTFDFAISIAVIHHLSSTERRRKAIQAILELLKPNFCSDIHPSNLDHPDNSKSKVGSSPGKALFFVWALEQKGSRRGWDKGDEQDVLVPWVFNPEITGNSKDDSEAKPKTYHRYYHLYRQGELEGDIMAVGGKIVKSGYDRDNWWAIAERQS